MARALDGMFHAADPFVSQLIMMYKILSVGFYSRKSVCDGTALLYLKVSQACPGRGPPAAPPGTARAVLGPVAVVLLIGTVFVSVYLAAFHAPRPHELRVGTTEVGTHQAQLRQGLARAVPGGFTVLTYPDESTARRAVQDRSVYAAYLGKGQPALRQRQRSRRHRHRDHRFRRRGPCGTPSPLRRGRCPVGGGGHPRNSSTRPSAWYWPDTSSA